MGHFIWFYLTSSPGVEAFEEQVVMCSASSIAIHRQFISYHVKLNKFVQFETKADEIAQQIQVKKDVIHFACESIHYCNYITTPFPCFFGQVDTFLFIGSINLLDQKHCAPWHETRRVRSIVLRMSLSGRSSTEYNFGYIHSSVHTRTTRQESSALLRVVVL